MSIEPNAKHVPNFLWGYIGLVEFMLASPGLYSTDSKRTAYHDEICKHYRITREQSRAVTDNLDRYENVVRIHEALKDIAELSTTGGDGDGFK